MADTDDPSLADGILEAGLALGRAKGSRGLTMRAIAAHLGVSPTVLYQHYDSKSAILRAIRLKGLRLINEHLQPAFELEDPRARLLDQSRRYVSFARANPWLYWVLLVEDQTGWEGLSPEELEQVLASTTRSREAIEQGMQRGVLRVGRPAAEVSAMIWATLHGLSLLVVRDRIGGDHPVFSDARLDALVDSCVRSLVAGLEA